MHKTQCSIHFVSITYMFSNHTRQLASKCNTYIHTFLLALATLTCSAHGPDAPITVPLGNLYKGFLAVKRGSLTVNGVWDVCCDAVALPKQLL